MASRHGAKVRLKLGAMARLNRVVSRVVRPRRDFIQQNPAILKRKHLNTKNAYCAIWQASYGMRCDLLGECALFRRHPRRTVGRVAHIVSCGELDDWVRHAFTLNSAHDHDSQREFFTSNIDNDKDGLATIDELTASRSHDGDNWSLDALFEHDKNQDGYLSFEEINAEIFNIGYILHHEEL